MRDISWDDMRLVMLLAREGSLLGAAKTMGVNPSTIGRRLEALESSLGVRIFDRTRQGVLKTAVAEELLPFVDAAEQAAAGFIRAAEGFEREIEGVVRISSIPGVASYLLARWMKEWIDLYPKLQIQIDSSASYVDLTRREADIALRSYRPQSGDLVAVKLIEAKMAIVASPAFVEEVRVLSDPASIPWISWGPAMAHLPDALWLRESVPETQIVLRTDSIDVQVQACLAGVGALLVAESLAQEMGLVKMPLAGELKGRFEDFPAGALWLVGHRALRHVPRVAAIWNILIEQFQRGGI